MSELVVVTIDDQDVLPVDTEQWGDLVRDVLRAEDVTGPCELNLTFVGVDKMTALNIEHMGGTGPTDVLSFPLDDDADDVFDSQPRLLGDIVICPTIVAAQAQGETDDEMALMVVHGVLHILGMDHQEPDEAADMKAAERRHLASWRGTS